MALNTPSPSARQTGTQSFLVPPTAQALPQTISVDALLKQFVAAPDPQAAALDHAVADRNVLSAQNSQLWKLIEKQRAGYNKILKELERIRGERDSYKSRLAAINGTLVANADKRHKSSSERSSRPSVDTSSSHASVSSVSSPRTRQPVAAEDNVTPRSSNYPQPLHSSRSFEPPRSNSDTDINPTASPPPAPPSSAPSAFNTARPAWPAPLVVPRADTLLNSYSITQSPELYRHPDANTITNNHTGSGPQAPPPTIRPLPQPRKSSVSDSISSIFTTASGFSSPSTSLTSNHTSLSSTANPPTNPGAQLPTPTISIPPPADFRQRSLNSSPLSALPPSHSSPNQMLNPVPDSRPQLLSRDSRISLPDEAKHFIVSNMTDTPAASPRVDTFSPRSKLSTSVFPSPDSDPPERGSGFLDLGQDSEVESDGDLPQPTGSDDQAFDGLRKNPHPSSLENNTNAYSRDHSPRLEFPSNYSSNSSREDIDSLQPPRQAKSRVVPEEFPLPPPANILIQRQQSLSPQDAKGQSHLHHQQAQPSPQVQQPSVTTPSSSKHGQVMVEHYKTSSLSTGPYSSRDSLATQDSIESTQQQTPHRSDSDLQQQQQHEKQASLVQAVPLSFRALPLLSSDLPHTSIVVSHSFVRPNDRGKEVLSFIVSVHPGNGKDGWKVEKMYSDVLSLDQRVRNSVGKGVGRKIAYLPEGKLWKDHAPAKVDQRKAVLENYLQTMIQLPVKNNDEVIAFFTSDIVREEKQPVMQAGHKEGYLTKRGKNFGGWKTRFFVLQGPVLEYYDCRGGAHLGSISITGAQIARQHRTERPPSADDEKEYRHAFLIVEAKKGPGGNHPRHVLCAESDEDRDSWVEMLVRYYTGTYSEDLVFNPSSGLSLVQSNQTTPSASALALVQQSLMMGQPRSSTSSNDTSHTSTPRRKPSKGSSSHMPPDTSNGKLYQTVPNSEDYTRSSSPFRSVDPLPIDRQGLSSTGYDSQKRVMERERGLGQPSSLPDPSPLSNVPSFQSDVSALAGLGQRANSELGHHTDMQGPGAGRNHRHISPERHRVRDDGRKSIGAVPPSLSTGAPPPPDRVPSPEKLDGSKVKISGPMNGAPIPSGFKFGGKELAPAESGSTPNDRREKAKSRSFWGFGKATGDKAQPHPAFPPRAVFGVPLEEALDVAQLCNLPAIVFRSIQYLEAKKADQEEGIYRLSGSSAVIKNLKDMFNNEGDVDLLASDEYWDPHAIAGLLKSFLRELPSSILTRDLHLKFLAVIDFVDPQERIRELSQLIAALPLANYSLLRALTAHLILIVQNSNVNKMNMRNVGIVFSPTLGIPAGVFSLMLGEFNRVFNVDADNDDVGSREEHPSELRRNSRQYTDAAADQVLGLSGRTLSTASEETQSDDDFSIQEPSETDTNEGDPTIDSPSSSKQGGDDRIQIMPETPETPTSKTTKASNIAASRGLNVAVDHSERGNRHSRMMGLPVSPRLHLSPSRTDSS